MLDMNVLVQKPTEKPTYTKQKTLPIFADKQGAIHLNLFAMSYLSNVTAAKVHKKREVTKRYPPLFR